MHPIKDYTNLSFANGQGRPLVSALLFVLLINQSKLTL